MPVPFTPRLSALVSWCFNCRLAWKASGAAAGGSARLSSYLTKRQQFPEKCVTNYFEKQERVQLNTASTLKQCTLSCWTHQARMSRSYQRQRRRNWPSASWLERKALKDGKYFPCVKGNITNISEICDLGWPPCVLPLVTTGQCREIPYQLFWSPITCFGIFSGKNVKRLLLSTS